MGRRDPVGLTDCGIVGRNEVIEHQPADTGIAGNAAGLLRQAMTGE